MDDVDGPVVAKAVYSELYSSGKELWEPDAVPFALDTAVRELRAKGITASRWAPYVHLGI